MSSPYRALEGDEHIHTYGDLVLIHTHPHGRVPHNTEQHEDDNGQPVVNRLILARAGLL